MYQTFGPKLLVWGSEMDDNTIRQASMASRLPFVYDHVSLMPDAHLGIGATVGSVIPTQNAIVPSFAGVDLGCVDKDSEYLSPTGWRKISEYDGGEVMQYNPQTGLGTLVQPERYLVKDCAEFYEFQTKYGVNQRLSADHRVLFWKLTGRQRYPVQTVWTAEQFAQEHTRLKQGIKGFFETAFVVDRDTKLSLGDAEIRVQVMVNADAHLEPNGTAVVRVKKQRKINRARELLSNAAIDYTERPQGDGTVVFRFRSPVPSKSFSYFWEASSWQLDLISDEVLYWDGNQKDQVFFTRNRESADFIQYAFAARQYRAVLRTDVNDDGSVDYRVFRYVNTLTGIAGNPKSEVRKVPSEDGKAYCFTVPSGFWVMRRGGNVVMTGNCGMIAVKTRYKAEDLPDDLSPLMPLVEKRIPAGVGKGHDRVLTNNYYETDGNDRPRTELTQKQWDTVHSQFGTLGSGNHFVEVSIGLDNHVWAVLHSGSRGIGNQLARWHMEKAKSVVPAGTQLEDKDLAFFTQGTPEFDHYIADMRWAQEYAFGSRERMMSALLKSLTEVIEQDKDARAATNYLDKINCHHNFTQLETHGGVELWITRKGAIKAYEGDRGIIPGSMGSDTYIVSGNGVAESWCSCSHGAGRRLSRTKAKAEISPEDLTQQMGRVKVWNSDRAASLRDESPLAYKPIEEVMADQSDLVTVDDRLYQVFNYKG
jgi:RNA-splicing ligase RtcB